MPCSKKAWPRTPRRSFTSLNSGEDERGVMTRALAQLAWARRCARSGGRIAISDIVTSSQFDPDLKARFQGTWAGCLGGSMEEGPYLGLIEATGFRDLEIIARHTLSPEELEAMAQCPGSDFTSPPLPEDLAAVVGKVLSIKFRATR